MLPRNSDGVACDSNVDNGDLPQYDGNASLPSSASSSQNDDDNNSNISSISSYNTDDEFHPLHEPPVLHQPQPNLLDVNMSHIDNDSSLLFVS